MKSAAKFIKENRIKAGLTQREISDFFGWKSAQFQSNFERGISWPPPKIIRQLAKLLKVKMQDLAAVIVADKQAAVVKEYIKYL